MRMNTSASRHLVALALTVSLGFSSVAMAAVFTDVNGHWAQQSIETLSSQKILGGYPDGTFHPEGKITRAEFAAMLVKASGVNTQSASAVPSFQDVPPNHWAYPSVEAVKAQGLVSGYPGGYYRPTQNISRAESMAILVKAAKLPMPNPEETTKILSNYPDSNQIPDWARPSVAAALHAGFLDNRAVIRPTQTATRAEVAVMTNNYRTHQIAQHQGQGHTGQQTAAGHQQQQPQQTANAPQQGQQVQQQPGQQPLQGHLTAVPAGTEFTGTVTQQISSETAKIGDMVKLTLDTPLLGKNGQVIVPQGSQIEGNVRLVEPAGRAGKNGQMEIQFSKAVLPNGYQLGIQAIVATEGGKLIGGTTKGRVLKALGKT
ncbi:MAG: S-layer homology domain-containing protein, partial [Vampirovibrio sp.]|nr:S-layer homology domain-containing protein [Vampirovibrio sp.]